LRSQLFFGVTESIGSRSHVLRYQTRFGQYRGCRLPFSSFALPNSFSTVARTLGPVSIFCAPGHVFGGNEGAGASFHILRSRTLFRRYRGLRVPFSCFALPNSFRVVPQASSAIFKFCAPRLFFDTTEGVGARFHVLRYMTLFGRYLGRRGLYSCFTLPDSFGRYRGRRVPISFFAVPDSFKAVPRASGTIFKFCAPGHVFGGTVGVGAHFHVLCSGTYFLRYRWRRVPFSSFALPYSFWALSRSSGLVFKFCSPGHLFGGTKGVRASFQVLRSQTLFGWYRGRRGSFLSFALLDTFLAVSRASGLIFIFCALGLFSGGTEAVVARF
jgi:hypothetical protein